jgi:hypothetical protein
MRMLGAAAAATLAFFVYGFAIHGRLIAKDYTPYPGGVYRAGEDAQSHVAFGLAGVFVAILIFTVIFSKIGHGVAAGARLGLLFGIFMVGAFVAVNFGTIHISWKLAVELAVSAPIEWVIVGTVVGFVYSLSGGQGTP